MLFKGTFKNKINQVKYDAGYAFKNACMDIQIWWYQNKDWAVYVIPVVATIGVKCVQAGATAYIHHQKAVALRTDQCTMWDPVNQIHVVTKHPLSKIEMQDYLRLRDNGMTVSEALLKMRLI